MHDSEPVTIIGAGIVGICCALSLQERGHKVRLIDPNDPGQGTSMGNAGIISPWSCIPQAMPGMWKNVPKWLLSKNSPVSIPLSYFPRFVPWGLRFLRSGTEANVRRISIFIVVIFKAPVANSCCVHQAMFLSAACPNPASPKGFHGS